MTYCTIRLSNGHSVDIDQVTGSTMILAAMMAGPERSKNMQVLGFYVLAVAVKMNNTSVGIRYIEELVLDDLNLVIEALNSQGFKVNGNG